MRTTRRLRLTLWPVLAIGLVLIIAPLAISLPSRASAGQKMLDAFRPVMQPAAVQTTVNYYNQTFTTLGSVATGGAVAAGEIPKLFSDLATALHMTQPQLAQFLTTNYPAMAQMLQQFPQLVPTFHNVTAGLAWYKPIIDMMAAQTSNYSKVDSLPNFNLFTWFFVVPGVLLVLFASYGLVELGRPHDEPAGTVTTTTPRREPATVA